ncbi:hypothetical protein QQ045_009060 [Rhodiola kirilowii]
MINSHQPLIVGLLETKKRRKDWDKLRCVLGFLNCFAVDRMGLSGGIAVLWREGVDVRIRNFSRTRVDMEVRMEKEVWLTFLYGDPNVSKRKYSWELLKTLSVGWHGPWLVSGDFNEVRFSWEAKGLRVRDPGRMKASNDTLDSCGLIDLGFQGPMFTFSNRKHYPYEAKAQLDRAVRNLRLKLSVVHAFGLHSDHCPLIINLNKDKPRSKKNLFAYQAMWLRHPEFQEKIRKIWSEAISGGCALSDSLAYCADSLKRWNDSCLGNVQKKVKTIKKTLSYIRSLPRTTTVMDQKINSLVS